MPIILQRNSFESQIFWCFFFLFSLLVVDISYFLQTKTWSEWRSILYHRWALSWDSSISVLKGLMVLVLWRPKYRWKKCWLFKFFVVTVVIPKHLILLLYRFYYLIFLVHCSFFVPFLSWDAHLEACSQLKSTTRSGAFSDMWTVFPVFLARADRHTVGKTAQMTYNFCLPLRAAAPER